MKTDRQFILFCALLVLVSIAATGPVLEMGLNDDFSYTYTARELAATGRLHYHGWASAMLGFQAWFAALAIRAFGFSFTTVRLTTSVFAVGCSLVLYRLGRTAGLNPSFAALGALALVLSPLFIPLAASFMTDVPALFFLLACFYCGMRALETADRGACVLWLSAAALSGLLGGTVRQVVWGAPLCAIPAIAFVKREDRRVVAAAAMLFAACAATIALTLWWLSRQPFFEWDPWPGSLHDIVSIFREPLRLAALLRTCLLLMLPVLTLYFFGWWRVRRWNIVLPGTLVLCAVWGIAQFGFRGDGFPFGNIVTAYGVLHEGTEAIGSKPVILSRAFLGVLSFVTLAATAACVMALLHGSGSVADSTASPASMQNFALVCAPFYAGYLLILLYRARFGGLFDRYLLIVLPAINLPLLWLYQQRIRARVPAAGWLVVGVFGAYGVAATHDYISAARARLTAASVLTAAGVPRTKISAGLEFDGWTEIETTGYLNNGLIRRPATAYKFRPGREGRKELWFRFWGLTPSVDPDYFVVYSRQPDLADTDYPPVTFSVWLPPFTRTVLTQKSR
jgi:dolichyl-phosphate-mannose-protein mannosyltransferase